MKNKIVQFTVTGFAISFFGFAFPQISLAEMEEYHSYSQTTYDTDPVGITEIPINTETIIEKPTVIEKVTEDPVIMEKEVEVPVLVEKDKPVVFEEKSSKKHHLLHLGVFPFGAFDLF